MTTATIAHYRLMEKLGAGGMGEVYRARDTRLGRDVALKLLPPAFAEDADRLARFRREAQILASLNHPHIAAIYGIEEADGVVALVLELVPGETLAERSRRGPVPVEESIAIARQMARGLEAAHDKGIVHRDLKPANVKLTPEGNLKILDFGLAKAFHGEATPDGAAEGSQSPTLSRRMTEAGVILGSAAYMSPEQARGKAVDKRADIWAFGVVLYEIVSGRRLFQGETVSDVLPAVLKTDPDWSTLPAETPPTFRRVLRRCLERDPGERFHDIADARIEMEESPSEPAVAIAPAPPLRRRALLAVVAVLFTAIGFAGSFLLRRPQAAPLLRASLTLPADFRLATEDTSLALSPDGRTLVLAGAQAGPQKLWLRALDGLEVKPIAGTEGATYPFWSPDGQFVGFFADGQLKKVAASGAAVQTICAAPSGRGASWGSRGVIVYAPVVYGGLHQVSPSGGVSSPLTSPPAGITDRMPRFLPDGRRLLFRKSGATELTGIYQLDLETKGVSLVARENSEGIFVAPDHLVFVRDGILMAQNVTPGSLALRGDPIPLAEDLLFNPVKGTGAYALSPDLLVYGTGPFIAKSQLTWFDASGSPQGTVGEPATIASLHYLSPDARRALIDLFSGARRDLWIYDLERGVGNRFTFYGRTIIRDVGWALSPDGKEVAYLDPELRVVVKLADGSGEPRPLTPAGFNRAPVSWSPDGKSLAVVAPAGVSTASGDIWILPVRSEGEEEARPFLASEANEFWPHFSPDGKWLSYVSDESGRLEVYVAPFPGPGGKWRVSTGGASGRSYWLDGGRRIAYRDAAGKFFAVDLIARGAGLDIGPPRQLLGGKTLPLSTDLTADGRRALAAVPIEELGQRPLALVTNWRALAGTK